MLDEHPEGTEIGSPSEPLQPDRVPTNCSCSRGPAWPGAQAGSGRASGCSNRSGSSGRPRATPALIATANQVRRSLRGPLGTVLNLGRNRGEDRDRRPRCRASARRGPRSTTRSVLIASWRSVGLARCSQGDQVRVRCDRQRRRGRRLRRRTADLAGRHEALPAEPLVALVPVSLRTGDETDRWTNRVSMLIDRAPDRRARPGRARAPRARRNGLEQGIFRALPAEQLTDFAEFPPPAVFARAMRLSARLRLGSRLTPGNLVISNIPGPRRPLYAARRPARALLPGLGHHRRARSSTSPSRAISTVSTSG